MGTFCRFPLCFSGLRSGSSLARGSIQIMPKPNYSFEKRKREMDKKAKKAEKAKRKAEEERNPSAGGDSGQNAEQTPPAANP